MKLPYRLLLFFSMAASMAQAAPNFWQNNTATPTPVSANFREVVPTETPTPTSVPYTAPLIKVATPTPTPLPGLRPKSPALAAVFSAVIPGSGQVYDADPLRGIAFAALFGVGLWQTLDKLALVPDPGHFSVSGQQELKSKDESLGSLFGLATLGVYGLGIQDALDGAGRYNKAHHLTLSLGLQPYPNASLAFRF